MPKKQKAEPVVVEVLRRWDEGDKALLRDRRSFWLSNAFYHDEQWVNYDERTGVTEAVVTTLGEVERTKTTHNLIKPNIETLLGKFLGSDLSFECPPDASDSSSMQSSRLRELVLEGLRIEQDWETLRASAVFDAFMGGTSAICINWDPNGARRDQSGRIKADGNVKLTQLGISEFTMQPGVRHHRDAYHWIRATAVPVEQVEFDYGLSYTPRPDAYATAHGPMQRRLLAERGYDVNLELCNVFTYYERPNRRRKNGLVVTVCNEKVIDGPHKWPFPFEHRLNIVPFRQQIISGRWNGDTLMNSARNVQLEYNATQSILLEHAKRTGIARMFAPHGSLDDNTSLTDTPGEIVLYYADFADNKPYWLAAPQIPRWQYQQPDTLKQRLDDIMHVNDVMKGIAPGDRNSGAALGILKEGGETPLSRMAREQANGWADVANLVLEVLIANVKDTRKQTVELEGGDTMVPMDITWNGSMLKGSSRVRVPLEATMPKSRTQRMIAALQLIDRGLVPQNPMVHAKMLNLGPEFFGQVVAPDAAKAHREHFLIEQGSVEFPEKFDDHGAHIAEHNAFRKSMAYRRLTDDTREVLDLHIQAHQRLAMEESADQMQMNQLKPGLGGVPQANAPPGSTVPPPQAAQQMAAAQMQAGSGGPPAGVG